MRYLCLEYDDEKEQYANGRTNCKCWTWIELSISTFGPMICTYSCLWHLCSLYLDVALPLPSCFQFGLGHRLAHQAILLGPLIRRWFEEKDDVVFQSTATTYPIACLDLDGEHLSYDTFAMTTWTYLSLSAFVGWKCQDSIDSGHP